MFSDRIEGSWIDAFAALFEASAVRPSETVAVLAETGSREVNVHVAELALARLGVRPFRITVPTPPMGRMIVRSTGASRALGGQRVAVEALKAADIVVDLTLEGLMHAPETPEILKAGTRILVVSNEHPEMLARMRIDPALKEAVREAARRARAATAMRVTSDAGSDLSVDMRGAQTVGVWGWTEKPGTLAHWPGGIVVSFPVAGTVAGRLVLQPGDVNLTYKRYIETPLTLTVEDDRVVRVDGEGVDARLMRDTLAAWGDGDAYAVSHVGWGLNPAARWDALTMVDRVHTNGTEIRAVPGNFLFSTGANEFAGRFTEGHFDLPMMGCTIALDGVPTVDGVASCERGGTTRDGRDPAAKAEKARLREEAAVRRDAAHRAVPDAGERLAARAALLPAALVVSAYLPMRSEIDPMPLAAALCGRGARLALPAILDRRMVFRLWTPGEPLRPGPFGTREPEGEPVVPDLLLVPLLAFTAAGDRLGYGAGYYDGFLAVHPEAVAVGVAYAAQEVPGLPVEPHDRPLDAVLTENGARLMREDRLRGD